MSFPRYSKYKPSGVEWLGDVPEGWTVRPLKTIASGAGTLFIDGDWIESKDISNAGIRYLTSGNVGEGFYKEQGQGFITDETFSDLKCTEVLPGDLLISRLNVPIGRACIVPDLGSRIVTCVDNVVVRPAPIFNRQFCVYLLSCKGHFENTEILGRGATMPRISRSALGRLPFAFPPLPEQEAIAEFLDRETGKIDELVAEQRRLMELLKEKRQAVISHAVTKGLNPHAPMKPSGIEWLGDVPMGWEVGPVKRFFKSCNTRRIPLSGEERGGRSGVYPYYGASGIIDHIDEFIFDEDLVLVSEDGANLLHRASPIAFVAIGKYWVNNHAHILRPMDSNLTFWAARIESIDITPFVTGSAQPKFTSEALGALIISVPSSENERVQIQQHITSESSKFDTLTAEAQRAIDLLQERRTALISAAVTGQIDVRQAHRN